MKLTNIMNLPQAIADAVKNDSYSKGNADYSVTQLLKPARIVALEKLHSDKITEDVADRIWSLFGQAVHVIAERANKIGIAERRLTMSLAGSTISGGMDLYLEDGTLTDYKTTSVWKVKNGIPDEYTQQLNIYAEILRQNNNQVKNLQVIAILRDWSKREATRDPSYPQVQVALLQIPLWGSSGTISFLIDRLKAHTEAKNALPLCSDEERWAKAPTWAVKKPGVDRAVKVCHSKAEAEAHAAKAANLTVEYRPGANIRCESYCSVAPFCEQFQTLKKKE